MQLSARTLDRHGLHSSAIAHQCAITSVPHPPQFSGGRVATRAFLSNWFGGGGAQTTDTRGAELCGELVALAKTTQKGSKASTEQKQLMAETADKLSKYGVKNPVRSPLLWGDYEVLYTSKPSAVGGPFTQGPGPLLFQKQVSRQVLEAPNKVINVLEFKTLGLLPGSAQQFGELKPLGPDTFMITFTRAEVNNGVGGIIKKDLEIQRRFRLLFLDETYRVVRFMPDETLTDSETAEGERSNLEVLFVFRRRTVAAPQTDGDEANEGQQKGPSRAGGSQRLFGGPRASSKTAAAGAVEADQRTVKRQVANPPQPSREQLAAQRLKEQAAARREAEAAKERQEAERETARTRAAAIKSQEQQLAEEVKRAGAAVRDATAELRDVERAGAPVLKSFATAEARLSRAAADVQSIEEELEDVARQRRAAEAALKQVLAEVAQAEAALRERSVVVARK